LLKLLFVEEDLSKIILSAKEERIDKQYYVTDKDNFQLNKESTEEMVKGAEDFLVELKLIIEKTGTNETNNYREKFSELIRSGRKKSKFISD
jgi:hypothetical protein